MTKSALLPLLTLVSMALPACGELTLTREVRRTPSEGEIALMDPRDTAHQQAERLMAARCPKGYDIVEEGEAVVGQTTSADTTKHKGFFGPTQTTTAQSEDRREWRVKYKCKTDGAATAKAAAMHDVVVRF